MARILLILFFCIGLLGCKKEVPAPDMSPETWFENSYVGFLTVNYSNVYPEWDVSTQMNVEIDKTIGSITISNGSLNYDGETLISDDSKITRSGSWDLIPVGTLDDTREYLTIEANLTTVNDIQRIYAKDDKGNWVMVNETDFSNQSPYSSLTFNMTDTQFDEGSIVSEATAYGSIIWTLYLTVKLD
jgi:hypothetical protein